MIFNLLKEIFVKVGAISNGDEPLVIGPRIFLFGIFIAIIQMLGNISSLLFIINYASIELEKSLFAVLQIAALTSVVYSLTVFLVYRQRLLEIANQIEEIQGDFFVFIQKKNVNLISWFIFPVAECQNSDYGMEAKRTGDKLTKFLYWVVFLGSIGTIILMAFLSGVVAYLKNGFIDISLIYRPYALE